MIYKCKMCGGTLEVTEGMTVCECEYCGTPQTLPRLDDERRSQMFDRANYYRMNNEFDKASVVYENILTEAPDEPEAHWGMCLCRYGIEYVVDPKSQQRIPTCHRTQFKSILEDADYLAAMQHADSIAQSVYLAEAEYIDSVQKGILEISSKEEPFDIFICYKESDAYGRRTTDSVIAQDIYTALTEKGHKVFFARITLEDKLGSAYEPYIFAALNSAKIMLVVGTKPEHFSAVWVKNEWSRYLALIEQKQKKFLIPCYRDMSPYDLPEEFVALQGQDVSKVGYMQDLMRGVEKILGAEKPREIMSTSPTAASDAGADNLLKRGMFCLEDGDWQAADKFFEQVLNLNAEEPRAYLGKLMAEYRIRKEEGLAACGSDFVNSSNYRKACRFGNETFTAKLKDYRSQTVYGIAQKAMDTAKNDSEFNMARNLFLKLGGYADAKEKAEVCRKQSLEVLYGNADSAMQNAEKAAVAGRAAAFREAAEQFDRIRDYKDAAQKAQICAEAAECAAKEAAYQSALTLRDNNRIPEMASAIELLQQIGDYRDAPQQAAYCAQRLTEMKQQAQIEAQAYAAKCELNKKRMKSAKKLLAAGEYTTVGLRTDGTVAAVGDDRYSECGISFWQKETMRYRFVKCGNEATVAIDFNGIIYIWGRYRTGYNFDSKWANLTDVALGERHVIGLNPNGKLVSEKCYSAAFLNSLNNVQAIASHGTLVAALKTDGTVAATTYKASEWGETNVSSWKNIVEIDCSYQTIFGLKSDGTVIAARYRAADYNRMKTWDNIVTISSNSFYVAGLKADGTVVADTVMTDRFSWLSKAMEWTDIVAIAAGSEHLVGLKSDGTLIAVGNMTHNYDKGQCKVEGIRLFQNVDTIDEEMAHAQTDYKRKKIICAVTAAVPSEAC